MIYLIYIHKGGISIKIKLGVVFGGNSVEHEVSIISCLQAIKYIDSTKYDVIPIYIDKNKNWYTGINLLDINNYKNLDKLISNSISVSLVKIKDEFFLISNNKKFKKIEKIDIVFPIVHGKGVEDGTIQGYLETIGIPYVGSSVLGSAIGQDKVVLKQVLESNNIPIVPYIWFNDYEYIKDKQYYLDKINNLTYPVIVKPASLGSSIGISYVKNMEDIEFAISKAFSYDKKIVVETSVEDLLEVNCSVMGVDNNIDVSEIEEVIKSNDILSFEDKYICHDKLKFSESVGIKNTNRVIPARISDILTKEIKNCSLKVFSLLNLSGVCRIDFLIDKKENKYYVNEPNTIPGSLSYYLWEASGIKYTDLINRLIDVSFINYKSNLSKISSFDNELLKNVNKNFTKLK